MKSPRSNKFTGINSWFIIEILSFYGYIVSAVFFIYEKQIKSSLGLIDKNTCARKEIYRYDFVAYHRKDLDWLAFVTILTLVNAGLLAIDKTFIFVPDNPYIDLSTMSFPLRHVQYLLISNHMLQMIFLRDFYDKERKVNTNHSWVWLVHAISYSYVTYVYYFTDLKEKESSETTKMWIPLDIILTINITLYQIFYNYI
jgi:hypothetical protein